MDKYEQLVGDAVAALRSEDEGRVVATISALSSLAVDELLSELCVWVEDVTTGKDVTKLLASTTLPLPEDPRSVIDAVDRNDLILLHTYSGGDLVKLIASMLALIASLQEAGERA